MACLKKKKLFTKPERRIFQLFRLQRAEPVYAPVILGTLFTSKTSEYPLKAVLSYSQSHCEHLRTDHSRKGCFRKGLVHVRFELSPRSSLTSFLVIEPWQQTLPRKRFVYLHEAESITVLTNLVNNKNDYDDTTSMISWDRKWEKNQILVSLE